MRIKSRENETYIHCNLTYRLSDKVMKTSGTVSDIQRSLTNVILLSIFPFRVSEFKLRVKYSIFVILQSAVILRSSIIESGFLGCLGNIILPYMN